MKFLLASVTLFAGLASTMAQTQPSVKTFKTFDDTGENPDPFDFEIGVPTLPLNTVFDGSLSGENEVGPFEFDLEGNDEAAGFSLSLASCPITGDDAVTPPTALGDFGVVTFATGDDAGKLGQTFVLKNPDSAFTTETWCIRAQLFLPEAGTDKKVAELDYTLTVNVQANGGFDLTASSNVKLPDPTGNSDIAVGNTVDGDVSVNEFIFKNTDLIASTIDGNGSFDNSIVLGKLVVIKPVPNSNLGGYDFKLETCKVPKNDFNTEVSADVLIGRENDGPLKDFPFFGQNFAAAFTSTLIPIKVFVRQNQVEIECSVTWKVARRQLSLQDDVDVVLETNGSLDLITTADVITPRGSGATLPLSYLGLVSSMWSLMVGAVLLFA